MSTNITIFALTSLLIGAVVVGSTVEPRFPGENQGYAPEQPIEYSHRLHAGELGMDCQYCHYGARNGRHAGVPSASVCMNCHSTVASTLESKLAHEAKLEEEAGEGAAETSPPYVAPELQKLYDAVGWDPNAGKYIEGAETKPIEWVRVHNLPDFVYFDHRPHVARGMECQACHGPVETMEVLRQWSPLTMGWCIECHRSNTPGEGQVIPTGPRQDGHVSTNCSTCHM